MTNPYSALKAEIVRLARKEVKAETLALKQTITHHRAVLSALKKQVASLEQALRQTRKSATKTLTAVESSTAAAEPVQRRFSPARLAAHRARLGLSAADYGKLVGMSGAIVYLWEKAEARPNASVVDALARLKSLTRAEVAERLSAE
jgi:DNA-binding transcriptional regulator YiaG